MRCECELDFHTSPFHKVFSLKNSSKKKLILFAGIFHEKKNIFWPFDIGATLPNDLCWPTAVSSCRLKSFWNAFTYFFFAEGKAYLHSMKTCMNATVWMSYSISAAWRRTKKNNYQFKSYFFCSKVHFLRGILHWTAPKHHLDN